MEKEYTLSELREIESRYLETGKAVSDTILKIIREIGEVKFVGTREYIIANIPGITAILQENPVSYNSKSDKWDYRRTIYITIGKAIAGRGPDIGLRETEVAFLSIGEVRPASAAGYPLEDYFVPGEWLNNLLAFETIADEKIAARYHDKNEAERQYLLKRLLIGKDV